MVTNSWESMIESRTQFLEPGALGTCICIHSSWCVCVCGFHDMYIVAFARQISMHMSLNGKEHMYISIDWLHDLMTLNLNVHGYSCCSNISNAVSWG